MPEKGRAEPVVQPATARGRLPTGRLPRKEVVETMGRFGRFFDALNTPIAVLVVLVVVVGVNVFLYLGYHSSVTPAPAPTERSS